jgi:23S rRNA pseudouridine2605 synthase
LARSGIASRRHADTLILQGRVKLNGQPVTKPGIQVKEDKDIVEVDGKIISPETGSYYIMLNKPAGYLVSSRDPHHNKLVTLLLREYKGKVFPIGRLDRESSGLLLFTNDGELAFRLSHPRFAVEKTYEVVCQGTITDSTLETLRKGIVLEDGPTAPASVKLIHKTMTTSVIQMTIHEGRKRQVRRMFKKVGYPVKSLKRIAFGGLSLGNLEERKFIHIKKSEVKKLRSLVRLK